MKRASRILILVASLPALGACAIARGIVAESLGAPVASKAVAEKRGRTELVATDGTWCNVSRGTFEKTEVGHHVLCTWSKEPRREPGGHGPAGSAPFTERSEPCDAGS